MSNSYFIPLFKPFQTRTPGRYPVPGRLYIDTGAGCGLPNTILWHQTGRPGCQLLSKTLDHLKEYVREIEIPGRQGC